MKNFDYLKDISELSTLHRYCDAAERNQYADPDVSALNARRALEWIARAIFRMKNVEIPERTSLFEIRKCFERIFIETIILIHKCIVEISERCH